VDVAVCCGIHRSILHQGSLASLAHLGLGNFSLTVREAGCHAALEGNHGKEEEENHLEGSGNSVDGVVAHAGKDLREYRLCYYLFQFSTQLNSTQLNSTQLNSTHLPRTQDGINDGGQTGICEHNISCGTSRVGGTLHGDADVGTL